MVWDILTGYIFIGIVMSVIALMGFVIALLMRAGGDDVYANNKSIRSCMQYLVFAWAWPILAVYYLLYKPVRYAIVSIKEAFEED